MGWKRVRGKPFFWRVFRQLVPTKYALYAKLSLCFTWHWQWLYFPLVCCLRACGSFSSFVTFTFMHLADAFIQSDLQLHSGYTFLSVYVFPGNRTHNLLRCWCNALPLSHTGTQVFVRLNTSIMVVSGALWKVGETCSSGTSHLDIVFDGCACITDEDLLESETAVLFNHCKIKPTTNTSHAGQRHTSSSKHEWVLLCMKLEDLS